MNFTPENYTLHLLRIELDDTPEDEALSVITIPLRINVDTTSQIRDPHTACAEANSGKLNRMSQRKTENNIKDIE